MFKHTRRPQQGQNFLHNRKLVKKLVGKSSIGRNDVVIEIGAGKGIITQELQSRAKIVFAIELDEVLVKHLLNKSLAKNAILFQADALNFPLPATAYKVFSNLPFSIEGRMLRKLLSVVNPPEEANLIVRKKPAIRWSGVKKNSLFSTMHKPWFRFALVHQVKPHDFAPPTKVKAVLLQIVKRRHALPPLEKKSSYHQFVKTGYENGRNINHNLPALVSKSVLPRASNNLGISYKSHPTALSVKNWVDLYKYTDRL